MQGGRLRWVSGSTCRRKTMKPGCVTRRNDGFSARTRGATTEGLGAVGATGSGSQYPPGIRCDPYFARLGAERAAVIDRVPRFILPLVHHLVQQRVQGFGPSMPSQVRAADGD